MDELLIRAFEPKDAEATAQLFFQTIHTATGPAYDAAQRAAWASAPPETKAWCTRLSKMTTIVAKDSEGLAGFMSLESDGHVDLAYVRADLVGQGAGKRLYEEIEAEALRKGIRRLYSEASELARCFFERQGWSLISKQHIYY